MNGSTLAVLTCATLCACATASTHAPSGQTPDDSAASSARSSRELAGTWAEYWSVRGAARTQRYVFGDDGRFVWLAAAPVAPNTSLEKRGTFSVEHSANQRELILNIAVEQFAPCSEQCAHHDEGPRRVEHAPALRERYELGDCAPNLEARALDAQYVCRAIAGRAFWRQTGAPSGHDSAPLK